MEGLVETFSGISRLELSGCVRVTIGEDGVIHTSDPKTDKLKQQGQKLVIEGEGAGGSSVMSFNGGSMVMNNVRGGGGGGQAMINGINGMTVTTRGSSTRIVTRRGKIIEFDDATDVIKLNGVALAYEETRNSNKKRGRKEEDTPPPPPTYRLKESSIENIAVKGASTLESIHHTWLNDSLSAQVSGSGDINLPKEKVILVLNAMVAGSGDITGSDTIVNIASLSVAGSGDISGFIIARSGTCSIAGSGDIKVQKVTGANITKSVAGTGSVRIK